MLLQAQALALAQVLRLALAQADWLDPRWWPEGPAAGGPEGPVGGPDGPAEILAADVCARTVSSIDGSAFGSIKLLTYFPCFCAPMKAKPDINKHNTAKMASGN